jgi:hypothetical protein
MQEPAATKTGSSLGQAENLTLKYPKKVEKGTGAPGEREQNQFPVFLWEMLCCANS